MFNLLTDAGVSAYDFSQIDISVLLTTFTSIVGVTIGVIVSILAIKKGLSWFIGLVKRA